MPHTSTGHATSGGFTSHLAYDDAQTWYRYGDGDSAHRRQMANTYNQMWDHNAGILRGLLGSYSIALIFLMAEVVALTLTLTLSTD